jgi:hypothetical protein
MQSRGLNDRGLFQEQEQDRRDEGRRKWGRRISWLRESRNRTTQESGPSTWPGTSVSCREWRQGRTRPPLQRLHASKAELLMGLDHPEIPLHTNGSENDIRCQVTKRRSAAPPGPTPVATAATPSSASRGPAESSVSRSGTTLAPGSVPPAPRRCPASPTSFAAALSPPKWPAARDFAPVTPGTNNNLILLCFLWCPCPPAEYRHKPPTGVNSKRRSGVGFGSRLTPAAVSPGFPGRRSRVALPWSPPSPSRARRLGSQVNWTGRFDIRAPVAGRQPCRIAMVFMVANPCRAVNPFSRPWPLRFTPPNGSSTPPPAP